MPCTPAAFNLTAEVVRAQVGERGKGVAGRSSGIRSSSISSNLSNSNSNINLGSSNSISISSSSSSSSSSSRGSNLSSEVVGVKVR